MIEAVTINVDDREVFYYLKPSTNKTATVVFIHGFPFSSEMWSSQLDALPDNIEGIAYDIRGFGKSDAGHNFFSIDLFSRDLLTLLDSLTIKKPILCGISMGGYIALRATQISPEKIAGLVLVDTNAVTDTDEGRLKRFSAIEQIQNGEKTAFTQNFIKNAFYEQSFETNKPAIKLIEDIISATTNSTICSTLLALASRTDTSEFLKEIKVPALIIRGAEDKITTESQALQLHENIAQSTFETVLEAGHLPNLENPDFFNFYLNNFLNKHFSA